MSHSNSGYAGADWVKKSLKVEDMSPLGEEVADFLGDLFKGIYHLPTSSLHRVKWDNKYVIYYTLSGRDISTVDFDEITRIVVLSHDRMLRVNIEAVAPGRMRLMFHKRTTREGSICERMPTIEEHIDIIRKDYNEVVQGV